MFRLIVAAALLVAAVAPRAQAPPPPAASEAAARAARAAERIQALQREADRLASDARGVLAELRRLEIDREIRRETLEAANAALAEASARLDTATARAEALAAQRVAETPGLETRLVELYKRGRGGYARLLLGADDVRDWGRTTRGVAAMARLDRLRVDAHRRLVEEERAAVAVLAEVRAEASAAQARAAEAARELAAAVAARNRRLEEIDRRRDLTAQYVGELEAARRALQATVTALASGAPAGPAVTLPLPPFRGTLDWPVAGRVSARFGRAPSNRFGTAIVRNGIEIQTPEDSAVRAVHEGTVAFAAPFTGYGTLVIVDHGDEAYSLYGQLAAPAVEVGTAVERGAVVGRSGVGPGGEPGVYFELRIDGRPVDPLQWLRSSP